MASEKSEKENKKLENGEICGIKEMTCSLAYNPCPSCGIVTSLVGRLQARRNKSNNWCDVNRNVALGSFDSIRLCAEKDGESKARIAFVNTGFMLDFKTTGEIRFGNVRMTPNPMSPVELEVAKFKGSAHGVINLRPADLILIIGQVGISSQGSEFEVEYSENEAIVKVISGKLKVMTKAGKPISVDAGMQSRMDLKADKLLQPEKFDLQKEPKWWDGLTSNYMNY